jgi:hypothetical protein
MLWRKVIDKRGRDGKKLPDGVIKINWGATLDKLDKKMGVGVMTRNGEGFVFATLGER